VRRIRRARSAPERDALTGLLTHAGLVTTGRRRQPVADGAVVILDLDNFRHINTAFSRPDGDRVLKLMARRVEASVPQHALVGRIGGDEFAVVLPAGGVAAGRALGQHLAERIAEPLDVHGRQIAISASVGTAGISRDEPLEQAIGRAGTAMADAKEQEPGRRVRPYHPEMELALQRRFDLEGDLRRAVAGGQFRLHYQPLVDLATNVTTEVEALIRWQHPTRGMLMPQEFLPSAEAAGLTREIGRWVLREACRQGRLWHDQLGGRRVVMAVNLSPGQFRDQGLLDDIATILNDTGFDPTLLRLEISESVTQDDIEPAVLLMQRVRQLGVRLALDDFGAGYAGWTFIQRCPIDAIKIDRSLLYEQPDALIDRSRMVEAIMAFARHLGVPVSIEGIERPEQAFAMRTLGISTAQGYYFAEPQPAHLIMPMLTGAPLQPIA
jgi:diguanylate cyclase (GGDEF)-like protein